MEELKKYIEERGIKLVRFSKALGIAYATLLGRLEGRTEFTVSEAVKAKKFLNLTDEEFEKLFNFFVD